MSAEDAALILGGASALITAVSSATLGWATYVRQGKLETIAANTRLLVDGMRADTERLVAATSFTAGTLAGAEAVRENKSVEGLTDPSAKALKGA